MANVKGIDIMELCFLHHKSFVEEDYLTCHECKIEIDRRLEYNLIPEDDVDYIKYSLSIGLHYNPNINGFLEDIKEKFNILPTSEVQKL